MSCVSFPVAEIQFELPDSESGYSLRVVENSRVDGGKPFVVPNLPEADLLPASPPVVHFRASPAVLRSRNSPGFEFRNQRNGPIGFPLLRHIIRNGNKSTSRELSTKPRQLGSLSEIRQGRTV